MANVRNESKEGDTRTVETTLSTYKLIRPIGEGGSSIVWMAASEEGEQFAIKVLRADAGGQQRMKRHRNELRFCEKPRNENIVHVLDSGAFTSNGQKHSFFVMPLYEGTLRGLMRSKIPPTNVLGLFAQVGRGVEAAHAERVIHRDLKPENILWDPVRKVLVVADFGIARFAEEELYSAVETRAADRLANFIYAAPEQRSRGAAVGAGADIYALGLMLNEMFTGEVPQGTGFRTVASVTEDFAYVDPVVDRMVRQDPKERFEGVKDVLMELQVRGEQRKSSAAIEALREVQVSAAETSHDLVRNPPQVIGFDYRDGTLVLKLDKAPTADWIGAFQGLGNFHYYAGGLGSPRSFSFQGAEAWIPVEDQSAQQVVDWFKGYLPRASEELHRILLARLRVSQQREKEAIQRKIEAEEQRNRILGNLKI